MKVFYPSYCEKFKCLADKCRHSCCVGWEVGIDPVTLEKYNAIGDESILSKLSCGEIKMREDGRCPFLRQDGLCRLICDYDDDCISEICREHPRFYHRVGNRVEMGIGASCEEAARLIFASDYADFSCVNMEIERPSDTELDTLAHREKIYAVLADESATFEEKIARISAEYEIEGIFEDYAFWNEILANVELLEGEHRAWISLGRIEENTANRVYYERFFAYLVFRHLTLAESLTDLRARLGFCILLTKILMSHAKGDLEGTLEIARIISEEIEYSEENTENLIFEIECKIL